MQMSVFLFKSVSGFSDSINSHISGFIYIENRVS